MLNVLLNCSCWPG